MCKIIHHFNDNELFFTDINRKVNFKHYKNFYKHIYP